MSFAAADADKPRSSAAPEKLPPSSTRFKNAHLSRELAIREIPS
jgi:hypothetical protein